MSEKSGKTIFPEDKVSLKPVLGIKPGVYLAFIYGIILLLILFFILLYPGISKPGAVIAIRTEPWGAAVRVDGVYIEAAPCEIFVPAGRRQIELSMPGFVPKLVEIDIGKRLFASVLFPLKMEIFEELSAQSPVLAFASYAGEYAAWTFAGEPSAAYQIPLSLSEGVYRLGPGAADPEALKSMEDTIAASARFAHTRAGLRDLIRAKTLLDNQGLSPSPISLLGSAEDVISFLVENPKAALWLRAVLTGESQTALSSSSWYYEAAGGAEKQEFPQPGAVIQAGGLRFRMIPGGFPLSGDNFHPETTVETFYICETVISNAAWETFLEEQPRWKKENANSLVEEGLINEGYLEAVPDAPVSGVSGISWYAAGAFCEWLSTQLNSQELEVRLPGEAEWEYAAKAGAFDSGHFWEWCEDPFVPLNFLSVPASAAIGSPERSVRGGSWVNSRDSVNSETRGSLPPSYCSPFVSARPVIAAKAGAKKDNL
jgi:formylglycine-generating enzyme required for sulfatase activity